MIIKLKYHVKYNEMTRSSRMSNHLHKCDISLYDVFIYTMRKNKYYKYMRRRILKYIKRYDLNLRQVDVNGTTALMRACYYGMPEEVAMLMLEKGDCNSRQANNNGRTALMYAKEKNMYEVVKILQDRS